MLIRKNATDFKLFNYFKDIIYLFLARGQGREKGRERNIDVREKHQLVASCMPPTGDLATTQACVLTGNQTGDFLVCRMMPIPVRHTSQGSDVLMTLTFHI